MSFIKDFKAFAIKGNMLDLAIGVVIGASFGKIINSLVADIFMPPFGLILNGIDFKKWAIKLKDGYMGADGKEIPPVLLTVGNFVQVCIEFFIIAFCIFLFVQLIHKMKRKHEEEAAAAPPPPPGEEVILLREIRDSLKNRS